MRKTRLREVKVTCRISHNPRMIGLLLQTQTLHCLSLWIFHCIITKSLEGIWFSPFLVLMSELSPQVELGGAVLLALWPHLLLLPSAPGTALLSPSLFCVPTQRAWPPVLLARVLAKTAMRSPRSHVPQMLWRWNRQGNLPCLSHLAPWHL